MKRENQISELLLQWEEMRDLDEPVAIAELCRNCPELLPELQQKILALESMRYWLEVDTHSGKADSSSVD